MHFIANYLEILTFVDLNRFLWYLHIIGYSIFSGYALLSSRGDCSHTSGYSLTQCNNLNLPSVASCEAYCSNQESCLAYLHFKRRNFQCRLIISDSTCPSGFKLYGNKDWIKTAKTIANMKCYKDRVKAAVCYGKISGKSILRL